MQNHASRIDKKVAVREEEEKEREGKKKWEKKRAITGLNNQMISQFKTYQSKAGKAGRTGQGTNVGRD